jgi:hypothetical protein
MCAHPSSHQYSWLYPRIFQPLQALSVLIAELFSDPFGEHALHCRAMVDSVLRLYQVDEGVMGIGLEDDRRELSVVGRETWDYILRARANALRKAGKDPHVLVPSIAPTKTTCVCGLEMSDQVGRKSHERSEREQFDVADTVADLDGSAQSPADMGLDWDAWDAYAMATLPGDAAFVQSPGFGRTDLD